VDIEVGSAGDPDEMTLSGPVAVRGAEPGEVLRIDLIHIQTDDWGYTKVEPGVGILGDQVQQGLVKVWDLRTPGIADFGAGIRVKTAPFLGIVGVAPTGPGKGTQSPGTHGGNLDIKHLTTGSSLWLPVQVPGALVSFGDAHAAQGDGEICGTAIETGATALVRLTLDDPGLDRLQVAYITGHQTEPSPVRYYCAVGIDPDLLQASRKATLSAVHQLQETLSLSFAEAYALCSVVADLRVNEVVDLPNLVVSACLPLSVLEVEHPG
jgi:acetamidase/formamidase